MVTDPRTPAGAGSLLPLNLPRPAVVEAKEGEPEMVLSHSVLRRVLDISDRWRIDDEWWRTEISRQYFALELEGGTRLTVFQDLVTSAWYQQQYTPPIESRGG